MENMTEKLRSLARQCYGPKSFNELITQLFTPEEQREYANGGQLADLIDKEKQQFAFASDKNAPISLDKAQKLGFARFVTYATSIERAHAFANEERAKGLCAVIVSAPKELLSKYAIYSE